MRIIEEMETKIQPEQSRPRQVGRPPRDETQSDAVRAIRIKANKTQQEMASAMECSVSNIQKLERLRALPVSGALRARLQKLADDNGVKIEDFEVAP